MVDKELGRIYALKYHFFSYDPREIETNCYGLFHFVNNEFDVLRKKFQEPSDLGISLAEFIARDNVKEVMFKKSNEIPDIFIPSKFPGQIYNLRDLSYEEISILTSSLLDKFPFEHHLFKMSAYFK